MNQQQPITRPSDTAKGRAEKNPRGDVSWKSYTDQWKANHGTLLMAFAGSVLLVGFAILAYQQNRAAPDSLIQARSISQGAAIDDGIPLEEDSGSDEEATDGETPSHLTGEEPAIHLRVLSPISGKGDSVRVALYRSAENFNQPEQADWKQTLVIDESGVASCEIPIDMLGESFAIAAYQDTNENGQLDRGLLGVPSEKYGFSNGARGKVGPPTFEQAEVVTPALDSTVEVKIW